MSTREERECEDAIAKAVDAIIRDMTTRPGFGPLWAGRSQSTRDHLRRQWTTTAKAVLELHNMREAQLLDEVRELLEYDYAADGATAADVLSELRKLLP